jgi:hypothetical protein
MAAATTAKRPKHLLRASSLRDCPRKAVFEGIDAPARERTPQEDGTVWRGTSIGRDYTIFLATQLDTKIYVASGPHYWVPPELRAKSAETAGVIAEQPIKWAYGIGHADIYLPETKTIVEVLSSAHASDEMRRSKMVQGVLYTEHHPQAENCAVVVVSPTDFTTERIVLMPQSRQYRELVEEMRERIAQIKAWDETGNLPPRVCGKAADARSHFCLHAGHCFEGWEPPPVEAFAADEGLVAAAEAFDEAKRGLAAIAGTVKELEQRKKDAQAILDAAGLPVKRPVRVGSFVVTRTAVQRKPTFDWERAEMAGRFSPDVFAEFFKAGASYSMFATERVAADEDDGFGEDAPWTSEDLDADEGLHG